MTLKQIEVYICIAEFIQKNGKSPTFGELSKKMGKKRGTLFGLIKGLEKRGYLKIKKNTVRGIEMVGDYEYDEHIYYSEDDIET